VYSPSHRAFQAILLCSAACLSAPLSAQTVRSGVDLSTSVEAVSNPYLLSDSDEFVGAGTLEVRPWLIRKSETDSVLLEAFVRLRAFTTEFDLEDSYGGRLQATSTLDPRTTAYGSANIQSSSARSRLTSFERLPDVAEPIIPDTPIPGFPIGEDINLIGVAGRSTIVNVQAGLDHQLDQRASVGGNVAYQRVTTENTIGGNYDSASAGLNYSYRLTSRTSIGLGTTATRTRYEGDFPDSTTVQAFASVNHQTGQYWFLSASAGLAVTRNDASRFGPADASLNGVGSVSACRRQPDQSFCLTASRSQQPSILGGTSSQSSIGLSLNQRVSARDRVDASASYVRSEQGQGALPDRSTELVSLRTTFTRSFSNRLDGYIYASGSRIYDDSPIAGVIGDGPSLAFGAGLRVRLGSRR
jgi:opacity protein-like surface antigen